MDLSKLAPITEEDFNGALAFREKNLRRAVVAEYGEEAFTTVCGADFKDRQQKLECHAGDIIISRLEADGNWVTEEVIAPAEYNDLYHPFKTLPDGSTLVYRLFLVARCQTDRALANPEGENFFEINRGDYACLCCHATGSFDAGCITANDLHDRFIPCDPENGLPLCLRRIFRERVK